MAIPARLLAALFAAGALWSLPCAAQAQPAEGVSAEDQAVVDLFFRDKITAVRRTRDTEDDSALIAEMLEKAREIPDSPGVQRGIYATAIELGVSVGAFPAAIDAMHQLRSDFPEDPSAADDALLDLHAQAYRSARRAERDALAEPYLDMLLGMAVRSEAAGDIERAGELYREGLTTARSVRSPQLEVFDGHVDRLEEVDRIESRIRVLTNALEINERNANAARELTMLLVLHRRDTATAAQYVGYTLDPDLIDVIGICADGPDLMTPPQALRVADWFYGLADQERDHALYLLGEAAVYYERFLDAYTRDDALRSRVGMMQQSTNDRLESLRAVEEEATRGAWRNAIEGIDPETHAIQDAPTLRNGQLAVANSGFVIPFQPEAGYDLRMRLRYDRGKDGITLYLPLGEAHGAVFHYSRWEHSRIQIDGVERNEDEAFMLTPGREVEVAVQVRFDGEGHAGIIGYVDGEECIRWEGGIDQLEVGEKFPPSDRHGNAIAVRCGGRYLFRTIEVRQPGG